MIYLPHPTKNGTKAPPARIPAPNRKDASDENEIAASEESGLLDATLRACFLLWVFWGHHDRPNSAVGRNGRNRHKNQS